MEKEIVSFSRSGTTLIARINCEIDHHTAARLRARIDRAIFLERPKTLCLDFSEVRFMDSSGIALILGRVETTSAIDAKVHLGGLSPTLFKLVRLSGIERIRNITVSPEL
jgi:stage II sporulation protein AA (anti-sigma F factor antagonist)